MNSGGLEHAAVRSSGSGVLERQRGSPDALGHLGLSPNVELKLLRVALQDGAERVRNAAAWRAGSLGPAATPLLPDLLRILDGLSPGDWGRSCVTRALEAMGSAAAPALEVLRAEDRAEGR